MSSASSIEWTDTTWNPIVGCAKVSQGCKHCYAETMAARHVLMSAAQDRMSPYLPVIDADRRRWNGRAVTVPERLAEPLSWKKPRRVFVNSMSDLFHEDVPFEFIAAVFGVMAACPRHTFQVLTKRPQRMLEFFAWLDARAVAGAEDDVGYIEWTREHLSGGRIGAMNAALLGWGGRPPPKCPDPCGSWPLPNVWLGVSVEDQATADERIPLLLQASAAVRFISAEPLLGPVKLQSRWVDWQAARALNVAALDWVIAGGESGSGARACDLAWIRSIVGQCVEAGVPCFVKQFGADPHQVDGAVEYAIKLRSRKGGDPSEWPADLRVRQWPEVRHG